VPELQSVTNCIPHRVTDSQLWVNILIFTLSFVSILFFFYLLICLLIFNINVKIYLLFSQLWRRAPVGCCIIDGWVDRWCSDVSLVCENQTATPSPSYTTYATTSACTEVFKYYTIKAPEFYTTTYAASSHYTDALKYYCITVLSYYTI
jgi:hypothetical protein